MPRAPRAIWVGIPRDTGSLEGRRDFLNFLNDIRVKTVKLRCEVYTSVHSARPSETPYKQVAITAEVMR